jgi:hypothetical protein
LLTILKVKLRRQRYFGKSFTWIVHIVKGANVLQILVLHAQNGSAHVEAFEQCKVANLSRNSLTIACDVLATLKQNILAYKLPPDPICFLFRNCHTQSLIGIKNGFLHD